MNLLAIPVAFRALIRPLRFARGTTLIEIAVYKDNDVSEFHLENHGIHSHAVFEEIAFINDVKMMLFFISRNFCKLVKNLKEYKTKLYFTIIVSVIRIDNDFNHRNFDRVSEPIKFRRLSLFSTNCPFGKLSVR